MEKVANGMSWSAQRGAGACEARAQENVNMQDKTKLLLGGSLLAVLLIAGVGLAQAQDNETNETNESIDEGAPLDETPRGHSRGDGECPDEPAAPEADEQAEA